MNAFAKLLQAFSKAQLAARSVEFRRAVRRIAGCRSNMPVDVVPGCSPPRVTGESYHYETRGGRRIYHPSAYSKSGWSNMIYVASTVSLEVGAEWCVKRGLI